MPSFNYPPTMAHQLPPTPPEYKPHFTVGHRSQAPQALYPGQAFPPRHHESGYEFIDRYAQTVYGNQSGYTSHPQPMQASHYGSGDIALTQPYRSARAPILPPIIPQDQPAMDSAVPPEYRPVDTHAHPEQPPKEEKATGGVAAHLDYEMDQMSEFVSEMAQGMYDICSTPICVADIDLVRSIHPGTSVSSNLRKYVHQILSSTRLPSSTILLALYLLSHRFQQLSSTPTFRLQQSGVLYRMLTTSLLLGSKFLDDNTFQNRSWSEVSNIPVTELNKMEVEWLVAIDWRLHKDPNEIDGFNAFLAHWEEWKLNKARAVEPIKLTPLDTNLRRHHSVSKPLFSPEGPIPREYQSAHFDNHWHHPAASDCSPPSAPHTGPTTPDYYAAGTWGYTNPPPPYTRSFTIQHALPLPSQPPSYQHTPYTQTYSYSGWTGHGSSCTCYSCIPHHDPYYVERGYRVQPIAG
jgi:hypothetical protein